MTAPQLLYDQAMDFSSLEDKMDLTSSPFLPVGDVEDLDFEFDQLENKHPNPSNDNTMDDAIEQGAIYDEYAQAGDVDFFEDDDLQDEDTQDNVDDLPMDEFRQQNQQEEEEILYEEDDEDSTVVVHNPEHEEAQSHAQLPHDADELLEPDEPFTHAGEDEQEITSTETDHEAISRPIGEQDEPNVFNSIPVEGPQDELTVEEQYTRDDGDGPAVDPAATELVQDPDVEQPQALTDAQVQLEESFEETFEPEQGQAKLQQTGDVDHSAQEAADDDGQTENLQADDEKPYPAATTSLDFHPVRLLYLDQEMFLFPPTEEESPTYLIPDTNLAFGPVVKLLESCREVLAESIDHHDELVLDIPDMGLHICEDSKYASQITLAQIVDVFLSLNTNGNEDTVGPLECALSSRPCLLTQFKYLTDQARKGRTFSDISAEHIDSPYDDTEADFAAESEFQDEQPRDEGESVDVSGVEPQPEPAYSETQLEDAASDRNPLKLVTDDSANVLLDEDIASEAQQHTDGQPFNETAIEHQADYDAVVDEEAEADPSGQTDTFGLDDDDHASEYFEEAIDEENDEGAEELQEQAEDQSVLREALTQEKAEAQSLLENEIFQDHLADDQDAFEGEEFLIGSDDGLNDEADADHEDGHGDLTGEEVGGGTAEVNGKQALTVDETLNGATISTVPPTTPSKSSKRKVSEDEDDLIFETDTPEPKRRRPS